MAGPRVRIRPRQALPLQAVKRRLLRRLAELQHDPAHCVHRHVSRAARAVAALYDDALAALDLTAGQFTTLMTLALMGPLSIGSLARELAMDATTVPRVIRPLVLRRHVAVRRGGDRRVRVVGVTAAGIERLIAALPVWERAQRAVVSRIVPMDWSELRHGIAALRRAVRGEWQDADTDAHRPRARGRSRGARIAAARRRSGD